MSQHLKKNKDMVSKIVAFQEEGRARRCTDDANALKKHNKTMTGVQHSLTCMIDYAVFRVEVFSLNYVSEPLTSCKLYMHVYVVETYVLDIHMVCACKS